MTGGLSREEILITFLSTHYVMKAEKTVMETGLECRLIPTPRQIHAECGFCLVLDNPGQGRAGAAEITLMAVKDLQGIEAIYSIVKDSDGGQLYEKEN